MIILLKYFAQVADCYTATVIFITAIIASVSLAAFRHQKWL